MARPICVENASNQFKILRILSVILITVSLLIILCLGCVSIKQFTKLDKLQPTIRRLFHIVWISSATASITFLISITLCAYGHPYTSGNIIVLQAWLICITILCILLTLLFRLYYTFKDTIYALKPLMKYTLIILYSLLILVSFFNLMIMSYAYVNRDTINLSELFDVGVIWLGAIMGLIYIITTVIAVWQFAQKLMKLAETRATSIEILKHGPNANGIKLHKIPSIDSIPSIQLNKEQIKLIEHTTKYIGLLSIGIVTSIFTMTVLMASGNAFGENWDMKWFQIAYIFVSFDATINTICLYLQYAFAKKYYEKYCKCIHLCWKYMLTQEAEKSLSKKYLKELNIEHNKRERELVSDDQQMPLSQAQHTYDYIHYHLKNTSNQLITI
eukprot:198282_1